MQTARVPLARRPLSFSATSAVAGAALAGGGLLWWRRLRAQPLYSYHLAVSVTGGTADEDYVLMWPAAAFGAYVTDRDACLKQLALERAREPNRKWIAVRWLAVTDWTGRVVGIQHSTRELVA